MRRHNAAGWVGGLLRGPRALYAVAPLFIPLIFATMGTKETSVPTNAPAPATYLPINYAPRAEEAPLPEHTTAVRVEPGDTLETLFMSGGLPREQAVLVAREFSKTVDPRKLRLGDTVRFHHASDNSLRAIELKVTGWGSVTARFDGERFDVQSNELPERSEEIVVEGTVTSSLYEAIRESGESPQLVASLVEVFQWDVDFFRLRKGDSFRLVVEKRFVGDDHVGYGPILAAHFTHNGSSSEAYRFEQGGIAGYYGRDGNPIKKQFLRAPLKYTRITSGFSKRRFHPVLQRFRPHYGVDYGAPTGTPVMSTADGVVVFAGFDRGEGNYVRIRHNSRIETSYLHLSRFAKGIKRGTRVEQGDVIGYVGATGLATGPHLDYRVSDGGKWLNPQQLKSITADPLRGESLRRFRTTIARHLSRMQQPDAEVAGRRKSDSALF